MQYERSELTFLFSKKKKKKGQQWTKGTNDPKDSITWKLNGFDCFLDSPKIRFDLDNWIDSNLLLDYFFLLH